MTDLSDPRFGEGGGEAGSFVHPPDVLDDDPEKNGLICFLDNSRPCGPDCMAYTAYTVEPKTTDLGDQSRNCTLLVNLERLGIHSVIAVGLLAKSDKSKKTEEADKARGAQQPPPNPLGGS